ncbi:ParA family protein [Fictibacillus enclensis]|uniref:ParA family protein n=1 Tax=Fictibacillus enclensis TaxID=1017270 RepID=UPI0025A26C09|nr:ParA family protein [Fictibacillus enclensis]MDM5196783.1 ParA family protein [Fictibacillus enclensis]
MAITISFGIQKGGVGKTTTAAITSYLLSKDAKVLAVDFDSQGNLTSFLTQRNIYDFTEKTVLQALKDKNPIPYIHEVTPNLHVLPAEDYLSTLPQYLYREYAPSGKNVNELLKETLAVVKEEYDYILIDMPPNLGDHTVNGVTASDYAVVLLQSEPFCYDALERYLEFLQGVKEYTNKDLKLAGILTCMLDARATIDLSILEKTKNDYEDLVFDAVIRRRSKIKEYTIEGIQTHTKKDNEALKQYIDFVKELKERVQQKRPVQRTT